MHRITACAAIDMPRLRVKPAWLLSSDRGDPFAPQLFRLLEAIHESGKLTLATSRVGLSYRYGWGLLNKWEAELGAPLVLRERGLGARLTPLGRKLLWAERQVTARLHPRCEKVAAELNVEFAKAASPPISKLRLHASCDYAVQKLPALSQETRAPGIELSYMGSAEALESLSHGQCDLAGFHVPDKPEIARAVWGQHVELARPAQQRAIRLVTRRQGLMTARGNPLKIRSLKDLCRRGVRMVNRQPGSPTRLLLDALLANAGIDPGRIAGYESAEFTHAAIAAFIASGAANVGLGVEAAARQFKLDFIPIATERYMLACNAKSLTKPAMKEFLVLLKSPSFAKTVASLPGYALDAPGTVVGFPTVFPGSKE